MSRTSLVSPEQPVLCIPVRSANAEMAVADMHQHVMSLLSTP